MLSIVVTFYDETAFLRTALRSVRNQGIDPLELIVINDNPERFTPEDMAALTDGFDVRVIHHHENRGLSAARNTGIDAANGDLIGFLDADDYYTVSGLLRHYEFARETGADITHACCYLGAEGGVHAKLLPRDAALHTQQRVVSGRMIAQEAQFIVSSWSSLYRTEFLARHALWFDTAQRKFEDRLFVLHTVTAARKIAFLGAAVRVWRRRANSISSAATTPETHLLQVQLLEKCMAHMRTQDLPARFEKRELFNSVSRLIWDMDILAPLAAGDPAYAEMGARIVDLLGQDSFGQEIFGDPMVAATSRVGRPSRHGRISRTDFFALHKAWRSGDFAGAQQIMQAHTPPAALPAKTESYHLQKRLVLHIGLHKTGTTFIQHHLAHHRETLASAGVLVPRTGFETEVAGRPGALSGHQGLVRAVRQDNMETWRGLHAEIRASTARTIVVSAENLSFPTAPDRAALIARLFERLGHFAQVDVVASVRAPHRFFEAFYAEWVTSAHPAGARSIHETLVDQADNLMDMPALFAPFEAATGKPVLLTDFDAVRDTPGVWSAFCRQAALPATVPTLNVPRYPTPDRASVHLMQLVNTTVANQTRRHQIMQAYFAAPPAARAEDGESLLEPAARLDLIDRFEEKSAAFCAPRGYAPDLDALRATVAGAPWTAPGTVPVAHLQALLDVGAQVAGDVPPRPVEIASARRPLTRRYSFVIRPRPWAVKLLDRLTGRG